MMKKKEKTNPLRATLYTLAVNLFLSVMKLLAGIFANSAALVADGANSASDVLSTIVVIIGLKLAGRKSDKDHPYGHERLECAAALLLAGFIFATGLFIGYRGVQMIIEGSTGEIAVPGGIALVAALITMAIKETMYWYTRSAAKKTGSTALLAIAWDHRSDVLASAGAFVGILGARIGLPILDPIASLLICLFIIRAAVTIFKDALSRMTDTSCDEEFELEIREVAMAQKNVLGVDRINTRLFGNRIFVDIEISADGASSLHEAHSAAQQVHDAIEAKFESVKHCMVHVNPVEDPRR